MSIANALNGIQNALPVEAYDMSKLVDRAVFDEAVGKAETCHLRLIAVVAHPFEDGRAKASDTDTVLDGDDATELPAYLVQDVLV